MIRTQFILTFCLVPAIAAVTICGCGSSPTPQKAPRATYGKKPLEAQPFQLSAGVAPAIAQGGTATLDRAPESSTAPAVAKLIEEVAAEREPEPVVATTPEVIEEEIAIPEPIIVEPVVVETAEIEIPEVEIVDPDAELPGIVIADPAEPGAIEIVEVELAQEPIIIDEPEVVEDPIRSEEPLINVEFEDEIVTNYADEAHISETLDPTHVDTLILMTGPGKLNILRDPHVDSIIFSAAVIANGKTLGRAPALSSGARVVIDQTALGRPRVRVIDPSQRNGIDYAVDLTVRMPLLEKKSFAVDIQDSMGDISISDFQGELSITSLRGGIEINNGGGTLEISSGKGPCAITGFEGPVKVRDGSGNCSISQITGDLEIWGRAGSLEIRYISGVVTIIDARDGVTVQSVEGNLNLYAVPLADSVIEGVSGSVVSNTGAP